MAAAREIEEVHIKRGQLHEDGTRDLSIVSKAYGKTEITSDSNVFMFNVWHWRLTPDYETKMYNYPKPPIEKSFGNQACHTPERRKASHGLGSLDPSCM
ncbi:hypothetical protein C8R48DRAFT_694822 [Suillus tomentosus]|nr:hypothetical protein C8R48DRAFT_694822 [Suillus tomentosus]